MAPEVSQHGPEGYDQSVDSWSLGVMVYMMCVSCTFGAWSIPVAYCIHRLVGSSPFISDKNKTIDWRQAAVQDISPAGK